MESPSFAGLIAISVPMASVAVFRNESFGFGNDKRRSIKWLARGGACCIGCGGGKLCHGSKVSYPKVSFFPGNVRNRIFAGDAAMETIFGRFERGGRQRQTGEKEA